MGRIGGEAEGLTGSERVYLNRSINVGGLEGLVGEEVIDRRTAVNYPINLAGKLQELGLVQTKPGPGKIACNKMDTIEIFGGDCALAMREGLPG